jgi:hypothetical protein
MFLKILSKLFIAVILFSICKGILPSLYATMKLVAFGCFVILTIIEFTEDKPLLIAIAMFGVVLLNPILTIDLNTGIQNIIYLITAIIISIWLICDLFSLPEKIRSNYD